MKNEIFIIDAFRTPIGRTFRGLKTFSSADLAALVIKKIRSQESLPPQKLDQVIFGNTVSAGSGQNLSRQAAFEAKLPVDIPAFTVNSVCAGGLQAVILAGQAIIAQDAQVVLAGGAESSSQNPHLLSKEFEEKLDRGHLVDSLVHDGLTCHLTGKHMGQLAEWLAEEFKISRENQDQYSLSSHQKACKAQEEEKFAGQILEVSLGENKKYGYDERPRKNINLDTLAMLPPSFKENGTVTAGNSSSPADGANGMLVVSAQAAKDLKRKPQARIVAWSSVAVEPKKVFTAAVCAIEKCLKKCSLSLQKVDLFEICEAFAVQAIYTQEALKIPPEKMNIFGGDVALGHPLGAAGSRALVTLIHALHSQQKQYGIVAVCFGGGGSVAMLVEKI